MIKRWVRTVFGWCGYQIRSTRRQRGFHPWYLAKICQPRTVIDVGVGNGTPALYEAYPEAKLVLVEPLREYEEAIAEIQRTRDCIVYNKALGNTEGFREIHVDPKAPSKSSFQRRTPLTDTGNPAQNRRVDVTTLDAIFREHPDIEKPILLKIDTEGHELEVLQGATELLKVTDTVIAEVSIARRFKDSYEFEDFVLYMKEKDFSVFDILNLAYKGEEIRPRFADIVFRREASASR